MASMQCYRSTHDQTCETKCHDNTFGYKVPQMIAGMLHKENHHGHQHHANNHSQGHFFGQSTGHHYPHPDHTTTVTHQIETYPAQFETPSHGQHAMSHNNHGHGHNMGQHGSTYGYGNGMASCYGKSEHKKKKGHFNKRRDGNWSCSDSGSDSD